ncbi:ClpP family protease [Brevibacterium linens]|uniref:ATP-dependent Clp protease proteolytic subunit n=1 Tax=Brevibacterium linens TaxID=1703 RepID=A0A2H1IL77_BRELN|nr:ATP-dependent Clp protease proteolytic subunit [Brevibacterium linens]SMX75923.1 Clp protease [Brevibacterium linens]
MMHAIADTIAHARILRHQGSSGIGGAADIELQGDDLRSVRDTVLHRIAEATGKTYDRIFDDSLRDRWFTAEEVIEYGLIDRVIDSQSDPRARIGMRVTEVKWLTGVAETSVG